MIMPIDYEVFKQDNERLARFILRFLWEDGYNAGYQISYPKNKIFARVDTKGEANQISDTIRRFMKELRLTESEIIVELNKPIRIPIRLLTQAENAANLTAKPELESEEPELEEREIGPELEPEREPEESEEPKELEPEPEEPEPRQINKRMVEEPFSFKTF
jgi:hypothetical protein